MDILCIDGLPGAIGMQLFNGRIPALFVSECSYSGHCIMESVYCATKAGLGMLGASLAMDRTIGKVLVVAPSGMKSTFWRDSDIDVSGMLDTYWVAEKIVELSSGTFKYKFAKILRNPERVVVEECLDDNLHPIECD